jgi:hypothetical protein
MIGPSNDKIPRGEFTLARKAAAPLKVKLTNEEFAALSKPEQRVEIAADVLEWISTKRLVPRAGTYIMVYDGPVAPENRLCTTDVEDINGYSCTACALGGVFALTSFRTGLSIGAAAKGGSPINDEMHEQLSPYFDRDQLALIECAFEQSEGFDYDLTISLEEARKARDFGVGVAGALNFYKFQGPEWDRERDARVMRAIMQNIIDNGGTFIP